MKYKQAYIKQLLSYIRIIINYSNNSKHIYKTCLFSLWFLKWKSYCKCDRSQNFILKTIIVCNLCQSILIMIILIKQKKFKTKYSIKVIVGLNTAVNQSKLKITLILRKEIFHFP